MRSALRSSMPVKMNSDSDDEPACIDSEGCLIIRVDGKYKKLDRKQKPESDAEEVDGRSKAGSRVSASIRKTSKSGWAYTGKEYASKKAGGHDVKRKDKVKPYAYWLLDRKMVSIQARARAAARSGGEASHEV